jgi:endonuclease YncB( thermonuclease family)
MRLLAACLVLGLCLGGLPAQQAPTADANKPAADPNNFAQLPENFNVYVVSVTDGNWFESEREGRHISIRLYGIQCPDRNTTVGEAAAQDLGRLVFGKTVHVKRVGYSIYGGILGIVSVDDFVNGKAKTTQVNESMISRGWAVVKTFLDLPTINASFEALQSDAKLKGVGLWYRPDASVQAK